MEHKTESYGLRVTCLAGKGPYISHYFFYSLLKITQREHKIEFLSRMVHELLTLQTKSLIFLIIFGFFVN